MRGLLVLTCTGVSFAHGSNDGQKGQGLLVLILVGVLPATYALKMETKPETVMHQLIASSQQTSEAMAKNAGGTILPDKDADKVLAEFIKSDGKFTDQTYGAVAAKTKDVYDVLHDKDQSQRHGHRAPTRPAHGPLSGQRDRWTSSSSSRSSTRARTKAAGDYSKMAKELTQYIPLWVKVAVACALGFGTMVGWKRIVVTVGEKIGKSHLTYGQGASAELVAMATIEAADRFGLPVSTTHILSSGVAGTMAANHAGLQKETLRNIVLAWVLTLPVCMILGAGLFSFGLYLVFNVLGLH